MINNKKLSMTQTALLDAARVAAIVRIDNSGKIPKIVGNSVFSKKGYGLVPQESEKIRLSINKEKIYLDNCIGSMERVDWFIRILRVFYGRPKLSIDDVRFYHSEIKAYPFLVCYNEVGMVLAPRVAEE